MGARFPKNTIFAYLGPDNVPVICKRGEAYEWLRSKRRLPAGIKSNEIDGWTVYTAFQFYSSDPDVPMFWQVTWYKYERGEPPKSGDCRFGTKEAALEFHAALVSGEEPLGEDLVEADDDNEGADWWKA